MSCQNHLNVEHWFDKDVREHTKYHLAICAIYSDRTGIDLPMNNTLLSYVLDSSENLDALSIRP